MFGFFKRRREAKAARLEQERKEQREAIEAARQRLRESRPYTPRPTSSSVYSSGSSSYASRYNDDSNDAFAAGAASYDWGSSSYDSCSSSSYDSGSSYSSCDSGSSCSSSCD